MPILSKAIPLQGRSAIALKAIGKEAEGDLDALLTSKPYFPLDNSDFSFGE